MIFTSKLTILHYAPSRDRFFTGHGGYQVLVRIHYFWGLRYRTIVLDREDVPHYHYVQARTLGLSEWTSRLLTEYKSAILK